MRADPSLPRGEARRVAERVRELVREHERRTCAGASVGSAHVPAPPVGGWVDRSPWLDTVRLPPVPADDAAGHPHHARADELVDDFSGEDDDGATDEDAGQATYRDTDDDWSEPESGRRSGVDEERLPSWQRLLARSPVRLDPGRRGAFAVGLAVLLAAVLTGVWLVSERPKSVPVSALAPSVPGASTVLPAGSDASAASGSASPAAASSGGAGAAAPATGDSEVVVDVAGKVRRPGLYRLPPQSRIDDALDAAGGPLTGVRLDSLNLAAKVIDGQQIVVGLPGSSAAALPAAGATGVGSGGDGATATASAPVSLNSATLEQLETLPGVGPVLGQQILDWRSAHGSFTSITQLNDVTGIGDVRFKEISPLVTL